MSILEIILSIFLSLWQMIFSLVPQFALPESAISAIENIFTLISTIGFFMPLQTLSQVLILSITFYFIEFFITFLQYFFGKIPFLNIR